MASIAIPGRINLKVSVAVVALLAALVFAVLDASPAYAEGNVSVSVQGKGDVSATGIDCDESGGPDCSEFYQDVKVGEECMQERPFTCFPVFGPPTVTFTAGPDRNGYTLDGWTGCDATAGRDCSASIDGDRSVTARFRDVQAPGFGTHSGTVGTNEGQTATNSGTFSDNASGDVVITASRGTVTKLGGNSGTWNWSLATDDGPGESGPVTISARDSSGNLSHTTFVLVVNNVAPTATFNAPNSSFSGKSFVISLSDPNDPSAADRNSGFTYAFDCGTGSGYTALTSSSVRTCSTFSSSGSQTVRAKVRDKNGGESEYTDVVTRASAPASRPNGLIAYTRGCDPYTMNADGSNQVRRGSGCADAALSPDGKRLAFTNNAGEITVMNVNGTQASTITNSAGFNWQPSFSPNGQKIAFISSRDGNNEVYVMNADGSGQTNISNDPGDDADPAYSPSGSQLAFASSRDGDYELYVMNDDGSGLTRLTSNTADDADPAYSPSGSQLAFASSRDGNIEIYNTLLGNTAATRLTNMPGSDAAPAYSPDGVKIAFQSSREGQNDIYTMSTQDTDADGNGQDLARLTDSSSSETAPSWGGAGDMVEPQTTIGARPLDPTNATTATFGFQSNETDSVFECRLDGGSFESCSTGKSYSGLAEGAHLLEVRATDPSGNVETSPAVHNWTVDTTRPSVSGTNPTDGVSNILESVKISATFTEAMDGNSFTASTFTLTRTNGSTPVPASVTYDAATRTATLDPTADLDSLANYTARITTGVRDRAGNALLTERTWNFQTGDTRPPTVNLTAPASGATVGGIVRLAASASDAGGVDVEFLVNGTVVGTATNAPYEVNWDSRTQFPTGGTANITARAVDDSNNQATSAQRTVTVDNVVPETSIDGPSGLMRERKPTFTLGGSDNATATNNLVFAHKLVPQGTLAGEVVWSSFASATSVTLGGNEGLADGTYTLFAKSRDAAGNEDPSPAQRAFTLDTTAPQTTLQADPGTPAEGATVAVASATFQFSGGSSFECSLDDETFAPCGSPKQYGSLSDGSHVFRVRATDEAGNVDATPAERRWTINRAPTVDATSLTPLKGATSVPRNTTASATFSEAMNVDTLNASTVKLQQYNKKTKKWKTIPTSLSLSDGDTKLTLDPFGATEPAGTEQLLAANKKFRVTISTGARDAGGTALARTFVWTFTTGKS